MASWDEPDDSLEAILMHVRVIRRSVEDHETRLRSMEDYKSKSQGFAAFGSLVFAAALAWVGAGIGAK